MKLFIIPNHLFRTKRNESGENVIKVNGEVIATVEDVPCDICGDQIPDFKPAPEGAPLYYMTGDKARKNIMPVAVALVDNNAYCLDCLKAYYPEVYEAQKKNTPKMLEAYRFELARQGILIKDGA